MQARIAVIKEGGTWSEMAVETDGANFGQAAENAKCTAWEKLGMIESGKLPDGVLAVCVLSIQREPDEEEK